MEITTSASFKALMVALICSLSRNVVLFLLLLLQVEAVHYNDFHLAFTTTNSPHSTDQGTNVLVVPAAMYVYSNYAFWNGGTINNHKMDLGSY